MIQILKLRQFTNKAGEIVKYDAILDPTLNVPSVHNLLKDLDHYLKAIPEKERWNLFYTLANCTGNDKDHKRDFSSQSVLAFDIDGIEGHDPRGYLLATAKTLGIEPKNFYLVSSGNGVHVIVALKELIRSVKWFKETKPHYVAVCDKLNAAFKAAGLPGACDGSIFEPRRILRLPGTENRKPNKPVTTAKLLQVAEGPVDLDLVKLSGLPQVGKGDAIGAQYVNKLPKADPSAVMSGCLFLKHASENAGDLNEPQWYAALSIVGRFDDKHATAHEISKGHPGYSYEQTEHKLRQAVEVSGPRTCKGIGGLWKGCDACPNYEKVKSPIMLQSDGFIASAATGFYKITWKGDAPRYEPDYDGLVQHFENEHPYLGYDDSRKVYTYNGTHYEPRAAVWLEQYALEHFDPTPKTDIAREFRSRISSTNLRPSAWWDDSTSGLVNFKNGVLEIASGKFMPHSPEWGFRYVLPFDFDETAECPEYDALMQRITCNDEELEAVLDEFAGYSLSGAPYHFPKALVLVGDGSNGKSTFVNILTSLIGEDHIAAVELYDMQKDPYKLATLSGKLLNISEETSRKAFTDSGLIKKLVSTMTHQAREPYGAPFYFKNIAKIIATCNKLPENYDVSHGLFRRLLIVPFNAKFSREDEGFDPFLERKIIAGELPGVFNRCLSGYKRLVRQGDFTEARAEAKVREEYKELSTDSVTSWAKDSLEFDARRFADEDGEKIMEMYELYKQTAEAQGEKPHTLKRFSMQIMESFRHVKVYTKRQYAGGNDRVRIFVGIKLAHSDGAAI